MSLTCSSWLSSMLASAVDSGGLAGDRDGNDAEVPFELADARDPRDACRLPPPAKIGGKALAILGDARRHRRSLPNEIARGDRHRAAADQPFDRGKPAGQRPHEACFVVPLMNRKAIGAVSPGDEERHDAFAIPLDDGGAHQRLRLSQKRHGACPGRRRPPRPPLHAPPRRAASKGRASRCPTRSVSDGRRSGAAHRHRAPTPHRR